MTYRLLYTRSASKDIRKLDTVARKKIKKKIESSSWLGNYRWRIGNYRVIFDIDDQKIIVLRVGHRKEIYR